MKAKVQEYQTIYDIALQYCGSVDAAIAILLLNNKPSEAILAGEELLLPEAFDAQILAWITSNNVSMATAVTANDYLPVPEPEPEPDPTCDPAIVTLFDSPFLTIAAGGGANIRVLRDDLSPATILSTNVGDIIVDFPDDCATFEELLSTKDWATQIAPNLNDEQTNDASVPYEVKYVNGTIIETDIQAPGDPLVVIVPNPLTPSGIAYFEPNSGAYPLPSFADYDDGWRIANNVFANTPPANPLYQQQLDWAAVNPFNTLLYPNKYGSFARYTRIGGSTIPWNGVEPFFNVEDHLIGRELRRVVLSFRTWLDALSFDAANGFYLGSQNEYWYLRNMTNANIEPMGMTNFFMAGYNGWTGTTDQANTANAIRLSSSYPTGSSAKTTTLRATIYLKLINP